jgi:hypothetical protein
VGIDSIAQVVRFRVTRYSDLVVDTIKHDAKSLKEWTHQVAQRKQAATRIFIDLIWLWDIRENPPPDPQGSNSNQPHTAPTVRPRNSWRK